MNQSSSEATPRLRVAGLTKSFGHVVALDSIDLDVMAGETIGLVGDNGAGKSTLIKVLSGSIRPDAGTIEIDGRLTNLRDSQAARQAGVETIFQDLALAPDLDAVANLFMGRELPSGGLLGRIGFLDDRQMRLQTPGLLGEFSQRLPALNVPVGMLSGGQRQLVAVARSAAWAKHVLLMDEPTSALGAQQTMQVVELIKRKAHDGLAVVLVSHSLPEVLETADRVVVLRLGRVVADRRAIDLDPTELLGLMTGLHVSGASR